MYIDTNTYLKNLPTFSWTTESESYWASSNLQCNIKWIILNNLFWKWLAQRYQKSASSHLRDDDFIACNYLTIILRNSLWTSKGTLHCTFMPRQWIQSEQEKSSLKYSFKKQLHISPNILYCWPSLISVASIWVSGNCLDICGWMSHWQAHKRANHFVGILGYFCLHMQATEAIVIEFSKKCFRHTMVKL